MSNSEPRLVSGACYAKNEKCRGCPGVILSGIEDDGDEDGEESGNEDGEEGSGKESEKVDG